MHSTKLSQVVEDLYTEHYKIPEEIKEDLSKWKAILCSLTERPYYQNVNTT